MRASGDGNAIVSPVSVWESLAMTHAGARGETAAEIADALRLRQVNLTLPKWTARKPLSLDECLGS